MRKMYLYFSIIIGLFLLWIITLKCIYVNDCQYTILDTIHISPGQKIILVLPNGDSKVYAPNNGGIFIEKRILIPIDNK